MRIIKPDFEIWEQNEGLEGIYEQIEKAGRICYASDPIEGKAKDFVDRMIKLGHLSVLEHGTIYLYLPPYSPVTFYKYRDNPYSKYVTYREGEEPSPKVHTYVTTNLRVLIENDWLEDLYYVCTPTEYHEKRVTVRFTTQIAITREYNRHRVDSIAEQSTRYCDYTNEKKFQGVGINLPSWLGEEVNDELNEDSFTNFCASIASDTDKFDFIDIDYWLFANLACEFSYTNLIRLGWLAQQARTVLPLDTNSELVHTAFVSDWGHFFVLRDDEQHTHPDAFALAHPLHQEFKCRGYVK